MESPIKPSAFASTEAQPMAIEMMKSFPRQMNRTVSFSRMSITDMGAIPDSGKGDEVLEEVLLILKWGGVLTHAGRQQAENLGRMFRMVMYPRRYKTKTYGPITN